MRECMARLGHFAVISYPQAPRPVDGDLTMRESRMNALAAAWFRIDRRLTPRQHDLTTDRNRHRIGAQIARDGQCAAVHHDPPLVFVVVDAQ